MKLVYLSKLRLLALRPGAFFDGLPRETGTDGARAFARWSGLTAAALFFAREMLLGGRISWVVALAALMAMLVGPWVMEGLALVWSVFLRLAAGLLGEALDVSVATRVAGFSTAGLLPLATGLPWLGWLSLVTIFYQVRGFEKTIPCGRFRASILAGFPALMVLTVWGLVTLIFKIKVL